MRSVLAATLLFVVVSAIACSTSAGSSDGACGADARSDVFVPGLSREAAGLVVRIVEAAPAPPAKGMNEMTIEVVDAAGRPVEGATLTLTAFMPDHGHGSAAAPVVTDEGAGLYTVDRIYLPMTGVWRLTVKIEMPGAPSREVTFSFCVEP